jgi:hypothetical protein
VKPILLGEGLQALVSEAGSAIPFLRAVSQSRRRASGEHQGSRPGKAFQSLAPEVSAAEKSCSSSQ